MDLKKRLLIKINRASWADPVLWLSPFPKTEVSMSQNILVSRVGG